jgi:hypothetical protein
LGNEIELIVMMLGGKHYEDPHPILDMMQMDLLPGLNLVLDMIDLLMQRAYLLLNGASPSPKVIYPSGVKTGSKVLACCLVPH